MGSVKDVIRGRRMGGHLFCRPGLWTLGLSAWQVSGRFSVADLKGKIPQQEIAQKAEALAMMTGRYWEAAASAGFQSTYVGMMNHDGRIVDTGTLLDRGELSSVVVTELANTPHLFGKKVTVDTLVQYHTQIRSGRIRVYVADAECIFRRGVPLGSTTLKRIFGAVGLADRYETLATYEDTVRWLDAIRVMPGVMDLPAMRTVLANMGLSQIPNPGFMMANPIVHFNTKFDPAGDRDITDREAQEQMNLSDLRFAGWKATLLANARHQREFCESVRVVNIDGKTEAIVVNGYPQFTDFACTIDENRLMIAVTVGDTVYLIATNKEIQRAIFRALGIYAAKEAAMRDHGGVWLDYLGQYVSDAQIAEATTQSVWMMEQAVGEVANRLLGRNVFEARPIDEWVSPFLPYASILQS